MDAGSVVVGLKLDTRQFDSGLKRVEGIKSPELSVAAKLDRTSINRDLSRLNASIRLDADMRLLKSRIGNLKANVELKADVRNLQRQINSQLSANVRINADSVGLTDGITKAIEKGFEKVKPKSNFLGSLFAAPFQLAFAGLQSVATGAFLGIGESISKEISRGLEQGISTSSIIKDIGSLELLGEVVGSQISEGISSGLDAVFPEVRKKISAIVNSGVGIGRVAAEETLVRKSQRQKQQDRYQPINSYYQSQLNSPNISQATAQAKNLRQGITQRENSLQPQISSYRSDYLAYKAELEREAEKIQVRNLTPEGVSRLRNREAIKLANQLEKQGDSAKALAIRSGIEQSKIDPASLSEKDLSFYKEFFTQTFRQNFVNRNLQKRFGAQGQQIASEMDLLDADKQQYEQLSEVLGKTFAASEFLGIQKASTPPMLFEKIIAEVAKYSGLSNIDASQIPGLQVGGLAPGNVGQYNPDTNTVRLSEQAFESLQAGNLDSKVIETLVHELRHAFQFGFGDRKLSDNLVPGVDLINPSASESRAMGMHIEASVAQQPQQLQPITRKLEADAYTFAQRNASKILSDLSREKSANQFESVVGIGGGKIETQFTRTQILVAKKIKEIQKAVSAFVDIDDAIADSLTKVESAKINLSPLLDKAANLELLDASEIEQLQTEIQSVFDTQLRQLLALPDEIKQTALARKQEAAKAKEQEQIEQQRIQQNQISQGTNETLAPVADGSELSKLKASFNQLTLKDIKRIAKELGVSGYSSQKKKNLTKSELIEKLLKDADLQKLESKLPSITPNEDVLAKASKLAALPVEQMQASIQKISAAIKQQLKQGRQSKDKTQLSKILLDIQEQESVVLQALGENLSYAAKDQLKAFQMRLARLRYQVKDDIGKVSLSQTKPVSTQKNQSVGNSELAAVADLSEILANLINQIKGEAKKTKTATKPSTKTTSQIEEEIYYQRVQDELGYTPQPKVPKINTEKELKNMARSMGKQLSDSLPVTTGTVGLRIDNFFKKQMLAFEEKFGKKIKIRALEIAEKVFGNLASFEKQIEASEKGAEFTNTTKEQIKNAPSYITERARNAVFTKSRYLLENSDAVNALVADRVNNDPTGKNQKLVQQFNNKRGQLAEVLEAYAKTPSETGFKLIKQTLNEVEQSLRELGTPLPKINKLMGDYTAKIRELQGSGEVPLDFDIPEAEEFPPLIDLFERFGDKAAVAVGFIQKIGPAIKGFIAFQAGIILQNILQDIATQAFNAYVELDRLRTAINFSSGSKFAGEQNLQFSGQVAKDLGVSLQESQEGFASLSAASRGTEMQGQGTRDLFLGMSQASTVLSLSSERSKNAFVALSQIMSKGKVSAEELRQQLSEAIPGAMAIAARATGVTEQEFNRLLESGQILSQDFMPKFAAQLQAEFGDAAKEASGNATSAIFGLQNAFLELQQGIGEGVAPAAIAGLNVLSVVLSAVKDNARELGIFILSLSTALTVALGRALMTTIANLIATKVSTGTLGGALGALATTINNSFSAQLTLGLTAVLTIVSQLEKAVNTQLVKSFNEAAKSARKAAEESEKAFKNKQEEQGKPNPNPRASTGVGRFLDDTVIGFLNTDVGPLKGGNPFTGEKFATYGELEQQNVQTDTVEQIAGNRDFLTQSGRRLRQLQQRKGDIGKLPGIDSQLFQAEQERQILQAQIQRDFVNKGQAVPAELKRQLENQTLNIRDLAKQRADIAKPFNLDITRADQQINSLKSTIENLKSPESIALLGTEESTRLQDELKESLKRMQDFKAEAESTLASLRVDPVLAFTSALRKLNREFGKQEEQNQLKFEGRKAAIAQQQVAGFSTDKFNTRRQAIELAEEEETRASADLANLRAYVNQFDAEMAMPNFQTTLRRLNVDENTSAAELDDRISNTKDDADKGILERLRTGRQQKNKLFTAQNSVADAQLKRRQAVQDYSLAEFQDDAATQTAALQKAEANKLVAIKKAQQERLISESEAAEKMARISLISTEQQKRNNKSQLSTLKALFAEGKISAEEFHTRQRDLTNEQTNLERQAADQRLAIFEAVNHRKLEELELVNRQTEAAIQLSQTTATTQVKQQTLAGNLSPEQAAQLQNQVEQRASIDRIGFIKDQIQQTKELREQGVLDAKTATEKELQLNQELAQANQTLIDQQIQAQQNLRDAIEKTFQRRRAQLELEKSYADIDFESGILNQLQSNSPINLRGQELGNQQLRLQTDNADIKKRMALLDEELASIDQLKLSQQEADDKRRENQKQYNDLRIAQIKNEQELIRTKQELEINGIERAKAADENRYRLIIANLDEQKSRLEAINASLDLTNKLNDSRANLAKAIADANLSPLQNRRSNADRALQLSKQLENKDLDPRVRSELKSQLNALSMGSTELEILEKRSQIEDEIAAKKLEALKIEQEFQRQALAIDLQRQRIASEMAVLEAQTAQITAARSKTAAEAELRIATIKKDDIGIQTAQQNIQLADKEIAIADRKYNLAQNQVKAQDELARNAILAQELSQRTAISNQISADATRKQANNLERVEAISRRDGSKNQVATSSNRGQNKPPANWENPFIKKKDESLFDYNSRIVKGKIFGTIREVFNTVNLTGNNAKKAGPVKKYKPLEQKDIFKESLSGTESRLEELKIGNAQAFKESMLGTEAKLDQLIGLYNNFQSIPLDQRNFTPAKLNQAVKAPDLNWRDVATIELKQAASQMQPSDIDTAAVTAFDFAFTKKLDNLSSSIMQLANSPRSLTVRSPQPVEDAAKIASDLAKNKAAANNL